MEWLIKVVAGSWWVQDTKETFEVESKLSWTWTLNRDGETGCEKAMVESYVKEPKGAPGP